MQIAIEIREQSYSNDEGEQSGWEMQFEITTPEGINYCFTVLEPYQYIYEEWMLMVEGGAHHFDFYAGNGEGSIAIDKEGIMTFIAAPSGAGGDVISSMSIPHHLIKPHLRDAIEKARTLGYFRKS